MKKFLILFFILVASLASGEKPDLKKTGKILEIDNEHVCVWRVTLLPNECSPEYRQDFFGVAFAVQGGTLHRMEENGKNSTVLLEAGKTYWFNADPLGGFRMDVNVSDQPIEIMVFELKNPSGQESGIDFYISSFPH